MRASKAIAESFGEILSKAREEADLTQEELAGLAGLDRSTISQVECAAASPQLETLIRRAGGLKKEPSELLPPVRWEPAPPQAAQPSGSFRQV